MKNHKMPESFTLPTEMISNSPPRVGAISLSIRGMSGKYFHVWVKVTFTEVSFEHAWIEVSVSICVQGQSLSRFGAVAKQWKLRTSKSWFGEIKNHKMSESFTLLACCVSCCMCCQCRLVMPSNVWPHYPYNFL